MKHLLNLSISFLFYHLSVAQNQPSFSADYFQWTILVQNETESFEPDPLVATVFANNISPTYALLLEEQVIVAYEQNHNDGWFLVAIQTSTGQVNWSKAVTKTTDNIRSFSAYLYQSSPETIELVGYEMNSEIPNSFGDTGYLFRTTLAIEDGSLLQTLRPKFEEEGVFVFNLNGGMAKIVHNSENDTFLIAEFQRNTMENMIGTWRISKADINCLEIVPAKYLASTHTPIDGQDNYQYSLRGMELTNNNGYMLLAQEWDALDFESPTNYIELIKLNDNGDLQWKKDITSNVGLGGRLVRSRDTGYIVYGRWNVGTVPFEENRPYFISKFDDDGNFQWMETLEAENHISYATTLTTEDGYLLGGVRNDQEVFLMKCDEDGSLGELANWKVSGEGDEQKMRFRHAIELSNGDIMSMMYVYRDSTIITSFGETITSDIGKNYIGLIKKDNLFTNIEQPTNKKVQLHLFPNPSNDKVNVILPQEATGTIQLYNTHGQLKRTIAIKDRKRLTLEVGELAIGLYYVEWKDKKGHHTVHPLLIQK